MLLRCFRPFQVLIPVGLLGASGLAAQAPVDPGAAPRAVAMDERGQRTEATAFLGRYLATAPDDGRAWFELGRFYWMDSHEWHLRGHAGDPPGDLYLDFAATALDQAVRLGSDSALVFRSLVEMGRQVVLLETHGWEATRAGAPVAGYPELPGYVAELGNNLVNSCPSDGVLATGSDLEAVGVWYAVFGTGRRMAPIPLLTDLYAGDSLYRRQMAEALGIDPATGSLKDVASRRPLCLSPSVDTALASGATWRPVRLVRVTGPAHQPPADGIVVTELLIAGRGTATPWARETQAVYEAAAKQNPILCLSVLAQLGDRSRDACGH
jgi:hypothetical protein